MTAAKLVRPARQAEGLSLRKLASRARIAHSRLAELENDVHDVGVTRLEAILRGAGYRLVAVPVTGSTAAEVADFVARSLEPEGGHRAEDRAFRTVLQLHDDLTVCPDHLLGTLVAAPAPSVGDRRFDALIAAIVEHHLRARGLPLPPWVTEPSRTVLPTWYPDDSLSGRGTADETAPCAFRSHGIMLAASELDSV